MVTYWFHLYSRSSHNFIMCFIPFMGWWTGRVLQRERRGHGFKSRWSPELKNVFSGHSVAIAKVAIDCDGHIFISFVFPQFTWFHSGDVISEVLKMIFSKGWFYSDGISDSHQYVLSTWHWWLNGWHVTDGKISLPTFPFSWHRAGSYQRNWLLILLSLLVLGGYPRAFRLDLKLKASLGMLFQKNLFSAESRSFPFN